MGSPKMKITNSNVDLKHKCYSVVICFYFVSLKSYTTACLCYKTNISML